MPLVVWFGKWTATEPRGIFIEGNVTFITSNAGFIQQSAGFVTSGLTLFDKRSNIGRVSGFVVK